MKISISTEKENINADNTCLPTYSLIKSPGPELVPYDVKDGTLSKRSYRLGFPTHSLLDLRRRWQDNGTARLEMNISPHLSDVSSDEREYCGMIELKADLVSLQEAKQRVLWSHHDVVCTPADSKDTCFVLRALIKTELVDEKKLAVIVTLEPRAQLVNTMPVRLTMLTKKPYALSPASFTEIERKDMVHDLKPGERMEIFSSGDSLHLKARCSDNPAKVTPTGTSEEWIRVPLTSSTDAQSPISCILPFEADNPSVIEGIEFFVAEANNSLPDYFLEQINEQKTDKGSSKVASSHFEYGPKRYLVTVGSYGKALLRVICRRSFLKSDLSLLLSSPLQGSIILKMFYLSKSRRRQGRRAMQRSNFRRSALSSMEAIVA